MLLTYLINDQFHVSFPSFLCCFFLMIDSSIEMPPLAAGEKPAGDSALNSPAGERPSLLPPAKTPLRTHIAEATEQQRCEDDARDAKADPRQARNNPRAHIRELLLQRVQLREEDLIANMLGLQNQLSQHLGGSLRLRD